MWNQISDFVINLNTLWKFFFCRDYFSETFYERGAAKLYDFEISDCYGCAGF